MLKNIAFRVGNNTSLDARAYAINAIRTLPLSQLMARLYPLLYSVHDFPSEVRTVFACVCRLYVPVAISCVAHFPTSC